MPLESSLFGPDSSDVPTEPIEEVGDFFEVSARQFVNRWVYLAHQRPIALHELRILIAQAKAVK